MESTETRIVKELLSILNEEELIRFRRRSQKAGRNWLVALFESEIRKRGH